MGDEAQRGAHGGHEEREHQLPIQPAVEEAGQGAQQVADAHADRYVGDGVNGDAVDEAQVDEGRSEDVDVDALVGTVRK